VLQVKEQEQEMQDAHAKVRELEGAMEASKVERVELEVSLNSRIKSLEERLQQSTRENDLLHKESGRVGVGGVSWEGCYMCGVS